MADVNMWNLKHDIFQVGDKIVHDKYGSGTVIEVEPRYERLFEGVKTEVGYPDLVTVKFDDGRTQECTREVPSGHYGVKAEHYITDEFLFTESSLSEHLVPQDVMSE